MHGNSALPKIMLYQSNGYFAAFCSRLCRAYDDHVTYAFSFPFTISPSRLNNPTMVSDKEDLAEDIAPLACVAQTNGYVRIKDDGDRYPQPPTPSSPTASPSLPHPLMPPPTSFELGMSLTFPDGVGKEETVVYKGVMPDGLAHTLRWRDGTRLDVLDAHPHLKLQADLSNIPRTPLDYCRKVGRGISKEEAEALVHPQISTPLQQELMDWHHCLYHLSFSKLFRLAEKGYLSKNLLKCKGSLSLCIPCKFGAAHCHPWQRRGKMPGSIRQPEHILLGDGVSMDQIFSTQPGLISQMSGYLISHCIWGFTTFCNHVSEFVYFHLMQNLTVNKTILAVKAFEKVMAQATCTVKHYHADNGAFAHKGFLDEVNQKDQKITFCAIGAHHQNRIIENKIK
jgi:hypothetical protein